MPQAQTQVGAGGQGIIGNAPPNLEDYRLGNDDQVRINVFNQDNLSGEFTVGSTGTLTLPLIGRMQAAGKTANELGQEIAVQLQDGYLRDPRVSVEVIRYRPFFIVGGVNRPGQFDYVPGMTVLQAVAIAGGYSPTGAQGQNVIISRNSRGAPGPSFGSMATPVFPGDTIEVPQFLLPTTTIRPGPRF
ncbi:MAG: polysaccharide biosynthesis/export family protein [Inquilinaceae bacterium]